MNPSFEQTLVEVWRQALVENVKVVELGKARYPVRKTPKRRLRQAVWLGCSGRISALDSARKVQLLARGGKATAAKAVKFQKLRFGKPLARERGAIALIQPSAG